MASMGWLGLRRDRVSQGRAAVGGGAGFWGALHVLRDALCVLPWGRAGMWDWLSQGKGPVAALSSSGLPGQQKTGGGRRFL